MVDYNQLHGAQPQESNHEKHSWAMPNDSPSQDKTMQDMMKQFQSQFYIQGKIEQKKRGMQVEQTCQRAHVFKQEVEDEVDEILQRIELLKKKFAQELSGDESQRVLSKSLQDYFRPLTFNKQEFMTILEEDMERLSKNLA